MRAWACVPLVFALACGSKTTTTTVNVIFSLDKPASDAICRGIVGFDVEISSAKRSAGSIQIVMGSPILTADQCHLSQPFSVDELDVNAPATVTVTGYDGNKTAIAQATHMVDNLLGGPVDLQLAPVNSGPILVVKRTMFTGGTMISALSEMKINTMKKQMAVLDVARANAGPYFDPEPSAYVVSPTDLDPGGNSSMSQFTINFTTSTSTALQPAKMVAMWMNGYYLAQ